MEVDLSDFAAGRKIKTLTFAIQLPEEFEFTSEEIIESLKANIDNILAQHVRMGTILFIGEGKYKIN